MKKLVFFLSLVAAVFVFSCDDFTNIEVPESLSIKTAAKFEFPMGNGAISIREKAGIEKIQEILNDNINKDDSEESSSETSENSDSSASDEVTEKTNSPEVYEYAPGNVQDSVMQYVINYPIKEISLRLDDGAGESTDLSNIKIPETTFEAPDFNASISETMTIKDKSFPMAEPGEAASLLGAQPIPDLGFDFDITEPDFATMEVRSGSMNIKITKPTTTVVSSDFSMKIKISLVQASNHSKVIASSGDELIECSQGKEINLDLADAELVPNMYIAIDGTISGGNLGTKHEYGVSMSPSSDFELKKVTGLNMSKDDLAKTGHDRVYVAKDFELDGLNSSLKEAEIEKGELDFYCSLPTGWSGIKIKNSNFVINGAIDIPNKDFSSDKDTPEGYILYKTATLDGKTVTPQKTCTYESGVNPDDTSTYTDDNVSWLEVALEDATIIFADSSKNEKTELTLSGALRIDSLDHIKISLEELQEFADKIDTGLNLSTILSDVLKGDNKGLIDDIEFADSDEASLSGYLFVSQPTDKEALADLQFKGTVSALYNKSANGAETTLSLFDSDKDGLLSMKNQKLTLKEAAAATEEKEANLIIDDSVFSEEYYSAKIGDGKITELINDKPDDLVVDYNLRLSSGSEEYIELDGDVVNALKDSNSSISISIALIVPLQLKLKDVADIPEKGNRDNTITIEDAMSLTKSDDDDSEPDKDLLDRDNAEDSEDWVKYAEALKKFELVYTVDNNIILNAEQVTVNETVTDDNGLSSTTTNTFERGEHPLGLKVKMYAVDDSGVQVTWFGDEENDYYKELDTSVGEHTFEFTKDEAVAILKNYPFIPKFMIEIPADGSLQYVPRDGSFGITGKVRVEFDDSVSVEVWNKNK